MVVMVMSTDAQYHRYTLLLVTPAPRFNYS